MDQKEAIRIMVQLVQAAQKRGAYSLDEAFLAFHSVSAVVQDEKYDEVKNYIKKFEPSNVAQPNNTLPPLPEMGM